MALILFQVIEKLALLTDVELDQLRQMIKSGVRSNELSILLSIGASIDDIVSTVKEDLSILDLIKTSQPRAARPDTCTAESVPDLASGSFNYPLIHPRYNTLNVFHQLSTFNFQSIQTHLNFILIIPAGSVDKVDFISVCRLSESSLQWRNDSKHLLSIPICIQSNGNHFNRKISIYY